MSNTNKLLISAALLLVLFFAVKKFFFKPDIEKLKYFTPDYYRSFKGKEKIEVLTPKMAKAVAAMVKESKGTLSDAETVLVGGLKKDIHTKTQLSFLSDIFQGQYKESMAKYIQSFGDKDTIRELAEWAKKLPSKSF